MKLLGLLLKQTLSKVSIFLGLITLIIFLAQLIPDYPMYFADEAYYNYENYQFGYHLPLFLRYFYILGKLFTGDWGINYSVSNGVMLMDVIIERAFRTCDLLILAFIVTYISSFLVKFFSIKAKKSFKSGLFKGISLIGISVPAFWFGLALQSFFITQFNVDYPWGYKTPGSEDPPLITFNRILDSLLSGKLYILSDYLTHLILPSVCLGLYIFTFTLSQQPFNKLVKQNQYWFKSASIKKKYDFKETNQIISTLHRLKLNLRYVVMGLLLIETIFRVHGLSEALIHSVKLNDFWLLLTSISVLFIIMFIIELGIDAICYIKDPRIQYI